MTVAEMIEKLKEMPQDVEVVLYSDPFGEIVIEHVEESTIIEEHVMIIVH